MTELRKGVIRGFTYSPEPPNQLLSIEVAA
jgi:hypothetical protein